MYLCKDIVPVGDLNYSHLYKEAGDISKFLENILIHEHLIDENKFIGWPIFKSLGGGFDYWTINTNHTKNIKDWHLIPGVDYHPKVR